MPFFPFRRPRPTSGEPPAAVPDAAPRRWGRWVLAVLIVAGLHLSAMRWIDRNRQPANPPPETPPVQIELLTPKPIAPPAPVPPAPAPAPPKPAPVPPKPAAPAPAPAPVLSATTPQPDAAAVASAPAAAPAAPASAPAAPTAAPSALPQAASQPAVASGDKFDVPPTGDLRYDTLVNGMMNQTGTIHWSNDGQHYEMVVSIPLPFVGPYVYSSKGHIDGFGIAPEQYSEQRGRRAADVAIFNREAKQIVYTKTPQSQPLADGAQDRFSVVMQLSSLVRGAPDKYKPGVTRQFSVSDNDSNEIWQIETVGDETVQTRDGFTTARHFTRLPRRDGDRRKLDIWLSPSVGWLPVRILQTEPNGMQIELLWAGKIAQAAAPAPDAVAGTQDASEESAPAAPALPQPDKP